MARKFGFPTVAALAVGESTFVPPGSDVKRKVKDYGTRNGKRFSVASVDGSLPSLRVVREADPEQQS